MDNAKRNRQVANGFYNLGLEKAKRRDLTGAVEYLKKSLRFDKYQMDARNLLGLVFYELGETADALMQWVISMNLHPEDNPADSFLEKIQRKPGQLEKENQTLQAYNQALAYIKSKNEDLAVLQLNRAVEANPHFVKAQMLLALICMSQGDYVKAGKSLLQVLQIDKSNAAAQQYMTIVKQNTGREEAEQKKQKNAYSHRQMEEDDIIIPPAYKESSGWSSILNIIAGLVIGMAAMFFLVMPAITKSLNASHNQELISYSQKINELNQELDVVKGDYTSLETEAGQMKEQLATIEEENQARLNQYQILIGILQAYRNDDLMTTAQLFSMLDASLITDEDVLAIVNAIAEDMTTNGYQTLQNMGTAAWNTGRLDDAIQYYEKSIQVKPDNTSAMFLLGRLYQDQENTEKANFWFGKILDEFPESSQAERAREARGY
ncbi:MAG: tetratricopeptide repeat protein [Lachnospiraceae bacterium]|nr:tetratricopeptide repeat protein [Lachnospiraceae bacterium]